MVLILILAIALAGCNPAPVAPIMPPTLVLSATQAASPTSASTFTATPEPSATPTLTAEPTSTSTPTAVFYPEAVLTNGPYLQSVTSGSMVVAWKTDLASSQWSVAYGLTGSYDQRLTDSAVGISHAVTLSGLAPYTLYHYRLENPAGPLSEDFTFRTAAGPDQAFRFVVFGDTQGNHHTGINQLMDVQPDFALHTGDQVDNGADPAQWDQFLAMEHNLMARIPLFPTIGNHESGPAGYLATFHLPGNGLWYTFDYGNARFVCLASDGTLFQMHIEEEKLWLEDVLAGNTQPWLIVFFHIPPYEIGPSSGALYETAVGKDLMPLFEQYGVNLVFNGHTHLYDQKTVEGVQYMTTGGYGDPYYLVTVNGKDLTVKGFSNGAVLNVFDLTQP